MAGGDEHTGVLSGAVAVDGRPGDAGDLQGVLGGDIHGVFRPAAQLIRGETCLVQDALHGLYMKGLSVVGGTDDGQFLRGNAIRGLAEERANVRRSGSPSFQRIRPV